MFIRKRINRSGTTSVVVIQKLKGKFKELITIGISSDSDEIDNLVERGKAWMRKKSYLNARNLTLMGHFG